MITAECDVNGNEPLPAVTNNSMTSTAAINNSSSGIFDYGTDVNYTCKCLGSRIEGYSPGAHVTRCYGSLGWNQTEYSPRCPMSFSGELMLPDSNIVSFSATTGHQFMKKKEEFAICTMTSGESKRFCPICWDSANEKRDSAK
jgi:hypothetical protein